MKETRDRVWAFNPGPCEKSMTRVFRPPKTISEKTVMLSKIGLSALTGLFSAWQLARLSATALELSGRALEGANDVVGLLTNRYELTKKLHNVVRLKAQTIAGTGSLINRAMNKVENVCFQGVAKAVSFLWSKTYNAVLNLPVSYSFSV